MIVLLVHSKSKALISASRTRGSPNFSRRVLMNQPWPPDGVSSGTRSCFTRPVLERGEVVTRGPRCGRLNSSRYK
jgi:hypothetical protein